MTSAVQRRVDDLGERLRRSVVVNDPEVRLLYASRHFGDEDQVRINAALHRDAGGPAIAHVLAQGVHRGARPGRIPAAPEIGMLARLLVPVRWQGELLGAVVVIDADVSLTPAEVDLVDRFAADVAGLLVEERHADDRRALVDEADIAAWLSTDPAPRPAARHGLTMRGVLPESGAAQVLVVVAGLADDHVLVALRHAVRRVGDGLRCRTVATAQDRAGTLVLLEPPGTTGVHPVEVADRLVQAFVATAGPGAVAHVGIGAPAHDLDQAWRSARQAAVAARSVPVRATGPVQRWEDLGALQVLARLPAAELDDTAVPEPLARLLATDGGGRLVETLETYLSTGGSGQATSALLHVHRTTLYYRLDRIREITGLDVDDGDTRLLLHLGLLVHRLRQAGGPQLSPR